MCSLITVIILISQAVLSRAILKLICLMAVMDEMGVHCISIA